MTPASKVLLYRRIDERVRRLAPFLVYDPDPYLVLADGRLYWLLDAYTQSNTYHYAARHPGTGVNYLRNPVKVVVDAYEGTVRFYVLDEQEPILRVWRRVFPRLFLPFAAMPESLKEHLRYPEHLFCVQRDMLLTYHMTDPSTFFRKEDAWAVPTETTTGTEEEMIPYYVLLRLPGEKEAEFVLMQPLKPISERRRNMTAWMAARCDKKHYGEVVVYRLPQDRVFYGPLQVEGRIAQEPEISKLLTLWGQQQSSVVRGNLLVLPFGGDFLYVEPIYIVSNQVQQPELKLIVLVYRDRIVYGATPAEALGRLLEINVAPVAAPPSAGEKKPDEERVRALLRSFEEKMGQILEEFVTELEKELEL
ncbi:MAG: COG1615 family transporter [Firmicutes bacterium]|nr:COG1615 family transporter [Bacillota bacterium]